MYYVDSMSTEASIIAKNVTVEKNKNTILNGLEFEIKKGCITGLIGPSGSGKTTLMRSIVGVQKMSAGQLDVFGIAAGSKTLRHKIGYVTQSPAIYSDLTVAQNLYYFATLVRASRSDVDIIIREVQLEAQHNQLVADLSGGQKARVSLAVALLGKPDLLVLDEPTVGLDPVLREDLWRIFGELAAQGKTLLISSHVMDEADRCQELLLLRSGSVLWNDSRQKLIDKTNTSSVGDAFISIIKAEEVK